MGKKTTSIVDLIGQSDGIDFEFETIKGPFVSQDEIDNLIARTVEETSLDTEQVKAAIIEEAKFVFGDDLAVNHWLNTHNSALKAKPVEVLNSGNIEEIRKVLSSIAYGGVI